MMSRGRLPNFAAFFGTGATAADPPRRASWLAEWPSFWTGRWPSQHGFYCFRQLVSGTYRIRRVSPDDVVDSSFWMSLDEAGLRTCMLDVPLVPQTRPVRGIHVTDWGTHDRMLDPHAWPENVERELSESVGAHAVVGTCDAYGERRGWSDLVRDLGRGVEQRTELSLGLLVNDDWDCFATVYSESHCAGHQLWWAHDPSHPDYSRDAADPLEGVYEILDGACWDDCSLPSIRTRPCCWSSATESGNITMPSICWRRSWRDSTMLTAHRRRGWWHASGCSAR